jgi:hypothetical protein
MSRAALALVALLALAPEPAPAPPSLTPEQRARLGQLARDGEATAAQLKARLEKLQQELALVYAEFELDETRASRLEAEILDLQRQMLANYRKVQVGLRALVDKKGFLALRKRIDRLIKSAGEKQTKDQQPATRP